MSNNKQSMKLYTEEQVIQMIGSSYLHGVEREHDYKDVKEHILKSVTPIELPSDEEIDEALSYRIVEQNSFRRGAKWMRDKIQGGNK